MSQEQPQEEIEKRATQIAAEAIAKAEAEGKERVKAEVKLQVAEYHRKRIQAKAIKNRQDAMECENDSDYVQPIESSQSEGEIEESEEEEFALNEHAEADEVEFLAYSFIDISKIKQFGQDEAPRENSKKPVDHFAAFCISKGALRPQYDYLGNDKGYVEIRSTNSGHLQHELSKKIDHFDLQMKLIETSNDGYGYFEKKRRMVQYEFDYGYHNKNQAETESAIKNQIKNDFPNKNMQKHISSILTITNTTRQSTQTTVSIYFHSVVNTTTQLRMALKMPRQIIDRYTLPQRYSFPRSPIQHENEIAAFLMNYNSEGTSEAAIMNKLLKMKVRNAYAYHRPDIRNPSAQIYKVFADMNIFDNIINFSKDLIWQYDQPSPDQKDEKVVINTSINNHKHPLQKTNKLLPYRKIHLPISKSLNDKRFLFPEKVFFPAIISNF